MAAQTERYLKKAGNPPRPGAIVEGAMIWQNHRGLLDLAIMNIKEVIERLRDFEYDEFKA